MVTVESADQQPVDGHLRRRRSLWSGRRNFHTHSHTHTHTHSDKQKNNEISFVLPFSSFATPVPSDTCSSRRRSLPSFVLVHVGCFVGRYRLFTGHFPWCLPSSLRCLIRHLLWRYLSVFLYLVLPDFFSMSSGNEVVYPSVWLALSFRRIELYQVLANNTWLNGVLVVDWWSFIAAETFQEVCILWFITIGCNTRFKTVETVSRWFNKGNKRWRGALPRAISVNFASNDCHWMDLLYLFFIAAIPIQAYP